MDLILMAVIIGLMVATGYWYGRFSVLQGHSEEESAEALERIREEVNRLLDNTEMRAPMPALPLSEEYERVHEMADHKTMAYADKTGAVRVRRVR